MTVQSTCVMTMQGHDSADSGVMTVQQVMTASRDPNNISVKRVQNHDCESWES